MAKGNSDELTQIFKDYEFLCVETVDGFRYFMFGDAEFNSDYTELTIHNPFGTTKFWRMPGDTIKWREE